MNARKVVGSVSNVERINGRMDDMNREQRANIKHAILHLEANKILNSQSYSGWYCGNRDQFVKRHVKAIEYLRGMLKEKRVTP